MTIATTVIATTASKATDPSAILVRRFSRGEGGCSTGGAVWATLVGSLGAETGACWVGALPTLTVGVAGVAISVAARWSATADMWWGSSPYPSEEVSDLPVFWLVITALV
jgi:hypothetical protein